jgi:hypothetical protein
MLRQSKELLNLAIVATDDTIGEVKDSWAIRYLVVSTSNWAKQTVAVDMTRDALKQAPCYDPALPLAREMEIAVYSHYGRARYWPVSAPTA